MSCDSACSFPAALPQFPAPLYFDRYNSFIFLFHIPHNNNTSNTPPNITMSSPTPSNDPPSPRDKRSRLINVYDAIVGRVTAYGHPLYIPRSPTRATQHTSVLAEAILTPDEVLFRRNGAPIRFAEDDMYCAYEDLPDGALPSSDLLKSIHCYASRYYEAMNIRLGGGEEPVDERSMDETALLAFGILLEEAAREALGKDGDLVFTEGEGDLGDSAGGRKRQRTARY
ncbi:hypothetical protein QBC39DRAFT_139470, partial [Podospora conica]